MGTADQNLSSGIAVTFTSQIKGIAAMTIVKLRNAARYWTETEYSQPENWGDPWSHPQIRAMSQRELADLPFSTRSGKISDPQAIRSFQ
jgi:hypothetical protein